MDDLVRRAAAEQRAFITEVASRRNLAPVIIEKDFRVFWTLRAGPFTTSGTARDGHVSALRGTSLFRRTA